MHVLSIKIAGMEKFKCENGMLLASSISENYIPQDCGIGFKWDINKTGLMKMAITLWMLSGTLITKTGFAANTSTGSLWGDMQPVFGIFQDISMIVGALAIICGLITMVFKKSLGKQICITSLLVVLGCFLVPAGIMLVAIVGETLNDKLSQAFNHYHNSINTGGLR